LVDAGIVIIPIISPGLEIASECCGAPLLVAILGTVIAGCCPGMFRRRDGSWDRDAPAAADVVAPGIR